MNDTYLPAAGTITLRWVAQYADGTWPPDDIPVERHPLIGWHVLDGNYHPVVWITDRFESVDFGTESIGYLVLRIETR